MSIPFPGFALTDQQITQALQTIGLVTQREFQILGGLQGQLPNGPPQQPDRIAALQQIASAATNLSQLANKILTEGGTKGSPGPTPGGVP